MVVVVVVGGGGGGGGAGGAGGAIDGILISVVMYAVPGCSKSRSPASASSKGSWTLAVRGPSCK